METLGEDSPGILLKIKLTNMVRLNPRFLNPVEGSEFIRHHVNSETPEMGGQDGWWARFCRNRKKDRNTISITIYHPRI